MLNSWNCISVFCFLRNGLPDYLQASENTKKILLCFEPGLFYPNQLLQGRLLLEMPQVFFASFRDF